MLIFRVRLRYLVVDSIMLRILFNPKLFYFYTFFHGVALFLRTQRIHSFQAGLRLVCSDKPKFSTCFNIEQVLFKYLNYGLRLSVVCYGDTRKGLVVRTQSNSKVPLMEIF